jgi:anti-anti-sigma regulatory factor
MTGRPQDDTRQDEQLGRPPLRPNLGGVRSNPGGAERAAEDALHMLTSAVAVRRDGPRAWVRVTGQLTALTSRHLDDWLDWLITAGACQVSVSLATAEQIDEACLRILRVAQSRLRSRDGELLVTAGRPQVRAALTFDDTARLPHRPPPTLVDVTRR